MIIYFSGSSRNIKEDVEIYKRIIRAIHISGHNVSNDWIEAALLHDPKDWNISNIVADAIKGIENSELLIAEASETSTFGIGYEVALALQRRKPVLILVKQGMQSVSYATGLENELITYKTYDSQAQDIERIVAEFIEENEIKTKDLRFNFVIDRKIYNYLRLKAFRSGKTKAEVVRDLLLEDISKEEKHDG